MAAVKKAPSGLPYCGNSELTQQTLALTALQCVETKIEIQAIQPTCSPKTYVWEYHKIGTRYSPRMAFRCLALRLYECVASHLFECFACARVFVCARVRVK